MEGVGKLTDDEYITLRSHPYSNDSPSSIKQDIQYLEKVVSEAEMGSPSYIHFNRRLERAKEYMSLHERFITHGKILGH